MAVSGFSSLKQSDMFVHLCFDFGKCHDLRAPSIVKTIRDGGVGGVLYLFSGGVLRRGIGRYNILLFNP